jgi:hypothetical protein
MSYREKKRIDHMCILERTSTHTSTDPNPTTQIHPIPSNTASPTHTVPEPSLCSTQTCSPKDIYLTRSVSKFNNDCIPHYEDNYVPDEGLEMHRAPINSEGPVSGKYPQILPQTVGFVDHGATFMQQRSIGLAAQIGTGCVGARVEVRVVKVIGFAEGVDEGGMVVIGVEVVMGSGVGVGVIVLTGVALLVDEDGVSSPGQMGRTSASLVLANAYELLIVNTSSPSTYPMLSANCTLHASVYSAQTW